MKIKNIYIGAFGGLKRFSLDLSDGLNIIYGDNENGKTTVMTFIKCMFYSTGNKSKKGLLRESIREKYTPWDGSQMGGRIYFEHNGTDYCLEKEFRKSDSTDKTTLTNKDTGEVIAVHGNIGETYFGLSQKAFERSVFIDNDVTFENDSDAEADFNAKLSSAISSGDADVSKEKVLKNIRTPRNRILSLTQKAGTLAVDKRNFEELSLKLETSKRQAEERTRISNNTERLNAILKSYETEYTDTKKITDNENNIKNLQKLKDYIETKNQLELLKEKITEKDGTVINAAFLNGVTLGIEKVNAHIKKAESLSEEIKAEKDAVNRISATTPEEVKKEYNEIEAKISVMESKREAIIKKLSEKADEIEKKQKESDALSSKNSKINIPSLVLGIIFGGAALVLWLVLKLIPVAVGVAIISAIMFVLTFSVNPYAKKKQKLNETLIKLKDELAEIQAERNAISEEKANLFNKKTELTAQIEAQKVLSNERNADIEQKEMLLSEENAAAEKEKNILLDYFSKYKDVNSIEEINLYLKEIEQNAEQQKTLKTTLTLIAKDIGNISYEEALEKIKNAESGINFNEDFEAQKQKLDYLNEKITETKTQISALETELKTGFRDYVSPETVKREINELREKIKIKEYFCSVADTATAVIEESALSMRKNYGSELENETLNNFKALTLGKYAGLDVINDMNMRVEEADNFGMRNTDYLSKGTVNGAYLSLRLAISSLLSKGEPLPVMLDDSLSQFDDNRLKNAVKFLSEYSNKTQTVLFTCHGAVCDAAKEVNADIKKPF